MSTLFSTKKTFGTFGGRHKYATEKAVFFYRETGTGLVVTRKAVRTTAQSKITVTRKKNLPRLEGRASPLECFSRLQIRTNPPSGCLTAQNKSTGSLSPLLFFRECCFALLYASIMAWSTDPMMCVEDRGNKPTLLIFSMLVWSHLAKDRSE